MISLAYEILEKNEAGPVQPLWQSLVEQASEATKATGKAYAWGAFPSDDADVREFVKTRQKIRDFHDWNNTNPPTLLSVSKNSIREDVQRAVLAAPDFAQETAEPILTGAFNAMEMTKGTFIPFRRQHWRHKARRMVSAVNTLAEIDQMSGLIGISVADMLALEPNPAQSTLIWTNSKLLSLTVGESASDAGQAGGPGPLLLKEIAFGIFIVGVAVILIDAGTRAYNSITSNINSERDRQSKALKDDARREPERTSRRGRTQQDFSDRASTRKAMRERQEAMAEEEITEAISDRVMKAVSRHHNAGEQEDLPAEREAMRQRDAKRLRAAVNESLESDQKESRFQDLADVVMNGSLEDLVAFVGARLDHTDTIRRRSVLSAGKRRMSFLQGFANGSLHDPMNLSEEFWD